MIATDDLQPVILAAGKGTRMAELLLNTPKCLLPIVNKPMIQYPLEMLVRANFKSTIVIVVSKEREAISTAIAAMQLPIEVKFMEIMDSDYGSADNFRGLRGDINKDLLIISCDIVSNYDLTAFIRFYREKDASLVCLFSSIPSNKEDLVPARKLANSTEYDIVGFDKSDPAHIVYFEPDMKFQDSVPLKKSVLRACPAMSLTTKLQDAHVYILKNWLLKYIGLREQINSIKGDLVPSVVRKQFRAPVFEVPLESSTSHQSKAATNTQIGFFNCYQASEIETTLERLERCGLDPDEFPSNGLTNKKDSSQNPIRCYGFVNDSGFCIRTNNMIGFCEANRVLLRETGAQCRRNDHVKSFVDGSVGPGVEVGEKCSIKKSVIGENCHIESNVTIHNCILLGRVTVMSGSVLKNCVICAHTTIEAKCELTDCLVGPKQVVAEGSRHANESLIDMDL